MMKMRGGCNGLVGWYESHKKILGEYLNETT